jgi:hypothetical protein
LLPEIDGNPPSIFFKLGSSLIYGFFKEKAKDKMVRAKDTYLDQVGSFTSKEKNPHFNPAV